MSDQAFPLILPFGTSRLYSERKQARIEELMADITIYTAPMCGFCAAALKLLNDKGLEYTEIATAMTPGARAEMTRRAGGIQTVPQIFVNDHHIGGCTDLLAAEASGELDQLLANA